MWFYLDDAAISSPREYRKYFIWQNFVAISFFFSYCNSGLVHKLQGKSTYTWKYFCKRMKLTLISFIRNL